MLQFSVGFSMRSITKLADGSAEYYLSLNEAVEHLTAFRLTAIIAEIILVYLTFKLAAQALPHRRV